MKAFKNKPVSHYILTVILGFILLFGSYACVAIISSVKEMSSSISKNMKNTMDPKAPDPGKTQSENITISPNTLKVTIGTYLERIEDLDIKNSSWTYEFYLWFKWDPTKLDFLGKKDKTHLNELPFTIVNGDILKVDKIEEIYDSTKKIGYSQYFVKAKNTQFFDVRLYPIDKHDLIIPIEHKWLNRKQLVFVPDTVDSKVSSRVMVNGYDKTALVKLIEKPHAYKSARGNPNFSSGFKVDFSQYRMSQRIETGGLSAILKLFLIIYVAVIVTFIAPFSHDPSRYTVGALFTTAGANYVLASKLPAINTYSLAEIINSFCIVVIIIMMSLLAILPSVIFKDGVVDRFEKKLSNTINITMFTFFTIINFLVVFVALSY
jgi:hypothetical protein